MNNRDAVRNLIKAKNEEEKSKTINVTMTIPEDVRDAMRSIVWVERKSMSGVITELMRDYIEKHKDALLEYEKLKK